MSNQIDLKRTEQASFRLAAHADGTTDLSLGLIFTLLGFFPLTRAAFGPLLNMVFFLAFLIAITIASQILRRRLVPERIGLVKFGPQIRQRKLVMLLITIILAAAMVATWVVSARGWSPNFPDWFAAYGFELLVAFIVLAVFWGIAYWMGLRRYYLYGVLLAAGFPIQSSLTAIYEGAPFLAAGHAIGE